jgi:hypothetical protein
MNCGRHNFAHRIQCDAIKINMQKSSATIEIFTPNIVDKFWHFSWNERQLNLIEFFKQNKNPNSSNIDLINGSIILIGVFDLFQFF